MPTRSRNPYMIEKERDLDTLRELMKGPLKVNEIHAHDRLQFLQRQGFVVKRGAGAYEITRRGIAAISHYSGVKALRY